MRLNPSCTRYAYVDRHGAEPWIVVGDDPRVPVDVGQDPRWASDDEVWWRTQDGSPLRFARADDRWKVAFSSLASGNSLDVRGPRIVRHRTDPVRVLDTALAMPVPGIAWPVLSSDGRYRVSLWPDQPTANQQSIRMLGPDMIERPIWAGSAVEPLRMSSTTVCWRAVDGHVYGIVDVAATDRTAIVLARPAEGVSLPVPVYVANVGLFVLHVRATGGDTGRVCVASWASMQAGAPRGWFVRESSGSDYDHDIGHANGSLFVAATSPQGPFLATCRVVDFPSDVLTPPKPPAPPPFGVEPSGPKALGYFFGPRSKYGTFDVDQNCAVVPLDAWQDSDGSLPADVGDQIRWTITDAGVGVPSNTAIPYVTPVWSKVIGVFAGQQQGVVWAHEPVDRAEAAMFVRETRAQMVAAGVAKRPVVVLLREDRATDKQFVGVADALAPEIYFTAPAATYADMLDVARRRIAAVTQALAPSPLFLCIQAFDRNDSRWKAAPWALEAIQQAGNEALVYGQVLGLFWFAYARPGGVRAYPQLLPWHTKQLAVTAPPPLPVDPPTPKPPEPQPPGDTMTAADLRRYAAELQDAHLFGALKRFHDEVVLPRDRPLEGAIKSGAWTEGHDPDFWTGDVTTGGANGYFVRSYMAEYFIARDAGKNDLDASVVGFDAAAKAYRQATNPQ